MADVKRLSSLDGVRAMAILAVMMFHTTIPFAAVGYIGVDIFFVLSGFLITGILLREYDRTGTVAKGRFYLRRAFRLYPALIAVCLVGLLFTSDLGANGTTKHYLIGAAASLGYFQNIWIVLTGGPDALGHTWSLAQEEQFYLLWPMALLLLLRLGGRRAALLAAFGATLISSACYAIFLHPLKAFDPLVYFDPLTHSSGLFAGCALALVMHRRRADDATAAILTWSGAMALVLIFAISPHVATSPTASAWREAVVIPLAVVSSTALIAGLVSSDQTFISRCLSWRPVAALGLISYGVYLWHVPVFTVVADNMHTSRRYVIVAELTASILVGIVSWFTIEKPANKFKDRYLRAGASRALPARPDQKALDRRPVAAEAGQADSSPTI